MWSLILLAVESPAIVKRPVSAKTKIRPTTSTRTSLTAQDENEQDVAIAPRKVGLNRAAIERAAAEHLPIREAHADTYSASYLEELKSATPSRPSAAANQRWEENNAIHDADTVSGAGDKAVTFDLTRHDEDAPSIIPSAAEIREKKERRRRLALEEKAEDQEQDFISLNDSGSSQRIRRSSDSEDDDNPRSKSLIIPADEYEHTSKWGESRLERDDEDIAEGFDEFVDDPGRVVMGRTGLKQQEQARRREIEKQIRSAQHMRNDSTGQDNDHDDDDDGEDEGNEDAAEIRAYEAAQTKRGTVSGGSHLSSRQREKQREERLRRRLLNLPKPQPLPEMAGVVASFKAMVTQSEQEVERARRREEDLAREKTEIEEEETRVKGLLKEAGEKFERLKGASLGTVQDSATAQEAQTGRDQERGLENLGDSALHSGAARDE